jgi:hypothetical protein
MYTFVYHKILIMKLTYLFILLIACTAIAQVCRPGITELNVKFGEYSNRLRTGGDMFWDGSNGRYGLANENGNFASLFFAGGLWLGGKTPTGELKFAGSTYRSLNDNFDFYPGPLDKLGQTKENDCKNWDKIFAIKESDMKAAIDIVYHGQASPDLSACDKVPFAVKAWPAKGNPYFTQYYGFELPDQELASFFDYDLDGKYDPCKGDIPALTTQNCDYNSVYEVLASFPSQLYFNVFNDNGGPHRLSGAEALKMEVHSYFYTFDNKDGEDMSFFKFKALYKGDVPFDNFNLSLWLDPDLGCYQDDYIGTASKEDMIFVYNEDAVDGSNGTSCAGGTNTFGQHIPMVGLSFIQGLIDESGINTGLTSSYITDNCGIGSPTFPCDPSGKDSSFYSTMNGHKYVFNGNPANGNDTTMCSSSIPVGDRRILASTGGIKLLPGESKEVIIAMSVAKNVPHPCPDTKYIIDVNHRAKELYDHCWQSTKGPDAPIVEGIGQDMKIVLKFDNNTEGHNNKNLSYEEIVPNAQGAINNKYKFEGYRVYQVNKKNYDLSKLGDSSSLLIFNFDLKNTIDSIFNWETIIEDNGQRKFVKNLKAEGQNNGVPSEIQIDYDHLNQSALQSNNEYHYVVVAYGYNNYQTYNPITKLGQDIQYVSSLNNVRVVTVKPKYFNKYFDPRIKRISGRGNYNPVEISPQTREKMLSNSFEDTIEYLSGKGPFDLKILDSTKVVGKTFRIEIDGPKNTSAKFCEFTAVSTYYTVTDIETGQSYKSQHPISASFDETFDDLGIAISIFKPIEPNLEALGSEGYIDEKIKYFDDSKQKWFDALHDKSASYSHLENVLDPVELSKDGYIISGEENQNTSQLTSGNFIPFYYSKNSPNSSLIPFVSATSLEVMPVAIDKVSGSLKLQDLNNVDVVFTSDKAKWSRCIVVETATSFYKNAGQGTTKTLEVKTNKSVDIEGNEETQSTGFSWFPGYAVDVETGQRLNVFFGENSALSKNVKSLRNPSIANDMLFNPSDELTAESNFQGLDSFLLNYPVGGGHYIYVTRQVYDECAQLSTRLKAGTSTFLKKDPLGVITWAAIPVLTKGSNMLSYAQGAVPNDLVVSMRVNNDFFSKRNSIDIAKFKSCDIDNKNPVYEITFDKKSNIIEKDPKTRWAFISSYSGFKVDEAAEDITIEVSDLEGNRISKNILNQGNVFQWNAANYGVNNSMVLVKIVGAKSGITKGYKSIVIW